MSRTTGTFNFAANFEVLAKAPLDAKQLVNTYADLTSPLSWSGSSGVWLYNGAIVAVGSDPTPANNGIYYLCDATNYQMTCAWVKSSSVSGTVSGATNGLSVIDGGTTVVLGGNLTSGTTISGQNSNDLRIIDITGFQVSGGTTELILEPAGITLAHSGITVNLDSNAGLVYGGDYSSGFTAQSLVDANYVTGHTADNFLKLDQCVPQDVCYGQPYFHEGLILHEFPLPSLVTGHTTGKMFYDPFYETITAQIGHPDTCGNAVNLQLGQEMHRLVWNETGVEILNGDVVRTVSTHCGGGICADTPAVCFAKADTMTCANVIGVATQVISASTYGFITTVGYVSDIDTTSGKYSGFTTGDIIYLSPTVEGGVTNIPPASPSIRYRLGRLTTTGTTAKLNVDLELVYRLDDLGDVTAPTPSLDDVLKWNGLDWVNAAGSSSSASSGINFYYTTPVINSRTQPAGISENGILGNGIQVATLSKTPITTGSTFTIGGTDATLGDIRAFVAWGQDVPLNRTTIDAGLWEFYDYAYVDTTPGEVYLIHQMYQVVPITGITTTGSGIPRTATITNSGFTGTYFSASTTNTEASYLQTPSGIFQISGQTSSNIVSIITSQVSGYTNETGVNGYIWNPLFSGSTEDIVATTTTLYQTKIIAPAFNVSLTDKLGQISFVDTTAGGVVLHLSYNGSDAASFFISPLATLHNELAGLQGGTGDERYHNTCAESQLLTGINDYGVTAKEVCSLVGVPVTLTGTELGYVDGVTSSIQTQLNSKLATSVFTTYTANTLSIFTGYTATTKPVIDNAITGATNFGVGTTIYTGTTGRNFGFNTFVGSGGTTVQKVGEEIVINSVTAGGGQLYSGQTPSAVNLCGITIGYELTGKTVSCILQDLLVPELFQTSVGTPSTSVGATLTGLIEIGCSFSQTITPTYSAGAITPLYCTNNGTTRGGPANNYSYSGPSLSTGFSGCTSCVINPYVVTIGSNTWSVCTRYDEGACVRGSKGTVNPSYPTVCAQDSCTPAGSVSLTGAYPLFATCADITTPLEKISPLYNMSTQNNICIAFPAETVTDKQKFEIPCAWLSLPRPLTAVCLWNSVGSTWEYQGGSAGASLTYWTPSSATETIQTISVGYCQYTYNGVQRGAACIRLVF